MTIYLNADSTKTREDWEVLLIAEFAAHPTKTVRNILPAFVPKRYAEILSEQSGISEKTATTVSKEERKNLVRMLFCMPLTLTGRRAGDEFVTAGGIFTDEINPETMQSKIHSGLYFAGEVLDIDAVTGGFNLQGCWATGYVAGKSVVGALSP